MVLGCLQAKLRECKVFASILVPQITLSEVPGPCEFLLCKVGRGKVDGHDNAVIDTPTY